MSVYKGNQLIAGTSKNIQISSTGISDGVNTYNASDKEPILNATNKLNADFIQDGTTNKIVSQSEKTTWNGKSTVSVSTSSGTSENVAKFITVDGTEYKLGGGIFYEEIVDSFTVTITDPRNDMPAAIYDGTSTSGTLLGYTTMAAKTVTVSSGHLYMVTSGSWNPAVSVTGGVTISSGGALNGQTALFDVSADGTITASTKE